MVMNGTEGKPKEEAQGGSFWEGLSKLQKLIGVFTGLIGLIGGLYAGYKFLFPPPPPEPSHIARDEKEIRLANLRKCANLEVRTFSLMPYYLVPTLGVKHRECLYWAMITGTNNCKEPLDVKVKFFISQQSSHLAYLEVERKEIAKEEGREGQGQDHRGLGKTLERTGGDASALWIKTIDTMKKVNDFLVPKIKFTKEDPDETLIVEWEIQTHTDNLRIKGGTENINIISKNYIYWDLKDAGGANVPSKFLLASLLAWTRIKAPELQTRAKQYLSGAVSRQYRPWFKGCYDDLLGPGGLLNVHPYTSPWPLAGPGDESRQRVRSPVGFITGKATDPNPLEAVLLVAALVNNLPQRPDLALFALPIQTDIAAKRFFLAWSDDGIDWRAIDLTSPKRLSFEENEAGATAELANLIKSKPDILKELNRVGVFIEGEQFSAGARQVVALNFAKAAEIYPIQGLP